MLTQKSASHVGPTQYAARVLKRGTHWCKGNFLGVQNERCSSVVLIFFPSTLQNTVHDHETFQECSICVHKSHGRVDVYEIDDFSKIVNGDEVLLLD